MLSQMANLTPFNVFACLNIQAVCKCADVNRLEASRFVKIMQKTEKQLHVKQKFVTNTQ